MASYIARAILWFIFAFVLFDTINEFNKLFALSLNPYSAVVPAALVYGFQEFMIIKSKADESADHKGHSIKFIIIKIGYVFVGIIVVCIFLAILIVWAGVIYKEIITG